MENINTTTTVEQPRLLVALESIRPEMAAYTGEKLRQINLDLVLAVSTVQGALPEIMALRPQIIKDVPAFDIKTLDKLEVYSLALLQANSLHMSATLPPEVVADLADEALRLRELLVADATALGKRGLVNAAVINQLKGPQGYRNIATDVLALVSLIRTNWDRVSSKTGITEAELNHAEAISLKLIQAIGLKDQAPTVLAEVALERQQAFSLFIDAYDQVRRAVAFLRWNEGDADDIAPSLYSGRATKKKTDTVNHETSTAQGATATSPFPPTAPTTTAPAATAVKATAGLPGADPFNN